MQKHNKDWLLRAQRIAHIGIWDKDPVSDELWWSDEIYRILGIEPKSIKPSFENFRRLIHPDDRDLVLNHNEQSFAAGKTSHIADYRIIRADKSEHRLHEEAVIEHDEKGTPIRITGILQDITERKRAEGAQDTVEKQYRRIVEDTGDAIYSTDRSGHFTYVNSAAVKLTGYDVQELTEMVFQQLVHPDWLKHVVDYYLRQHRDRIQGTSLIFPIITKRAKIRWIEQTVNIVTEGNRFVSTQAFVRDITKRKQAEYKLKEASDKYRTLSNDLKAVVRTRDKFFSIIAHDLKDPLATFHELSKLFVESFEDFTPDELKSLVAKMRSSSSHTIKLLENLLDWSRLQLGKIEFRPESVRVLEIVQENIDLHSSHAEIKNITLTNASDSSNHALVDRNMLMTIIRNLISNAIKFTRYGGQIVVSSSIDTKSSNVTISVSDTGIGLPDEEINSIFDIVGQFKRQGTDGELSTGLGLPLCNEFVQKHGGEMWVESEVGSGSTFYFTIPSV